jgi:hypothetical protein
MGLEVKLRPPVRAGHSALMLAARITLAYVSVFVGDELAIFGRRERNCRTNISKPRPYLRFRDSSSMLRATLGCLLIKPARSSVSTIW